MAKVHAITPILHGKDDGSVTRIEVGDEVTGLSDDEVIGLIQNGSAVEIGKGRKYTPEVAAQPADESTLKRDALIASSLAGDEAFGSPGALDARTSRSIDPDTLAAAQAKANTSSQVEAKK